MSLSQGRSDNGSFAIPLHFTSKSEGNTQEGDTKKWKLACKQTHSNNEIQYLKPFLIFTNSIDFDKL
jgi:hypothetical protein